jgi:hypothetical protein
MFLRRSEVLFLSSLIEGLKARYGASAKLALPPGTFTVKELGQLFQEMLDTHQAVLDARVTVRSATTARSTKIVQGRPILKAVKNYLLAVYGDPQALATFGLEPHKAPTSPGVRAKAVALDKREATRKARGTMGKRAKQKLHADLVTPPGGTSPNGVSRA